MGMQKLVILIVEEDTSERERSRVNFEALGYQVFIAAGVDEGVQIIRIIREEMQGRLTHLLIYARIELLPELQQAAAEDYLTGLDNFRTFEKRSWALLQNAKARKEPAILTLISTDVRKFGKFNKRFGKIVGNGVLKKIAAVLRDHVRPTDIICRHSERADEFLILSSSLKSEEEALAFGQRLEDAVYNHPWVVGAVRFSIGIYWGIAQIRYDEIESPEKSFQDLIRRADGGPHGLIARRRKRRRIRRH